MRLNTWEGILAQLQAVREADCEDGRIELLIELLVNLRLIGQDDCIPDLRQEKDNIETLYARLESETRLTFNSVPQPSVRLIYYAREVIKKLPGRVPSPSKNPVAGTIHSRDLPETCARRYTGAYRHASSATSWSLIWRLS